VKLALDTNVVVAALQPGSQSSRRVLRWCFQRLLIPQLSNTLFLEHEEITQRQEIMRTCRFTEHEAEEFIDALVSVSDWVEIYYGWRPTLQDEGDNYLIELAVASGAEYIVTRNTRDLNRNELTFDQFSIVTPSDFVKRFEREVYR